LGGTYVRTRMPYDSHLLGKTATSEFRLRSANPGTSHIPLVVICESQIVTNFRGWMITRPDTDSHVI
jgi:hypothetical protein